MKPTMLYFRPPLHRIPVNNHHVQFHKMAKSFEVYFNVVIIDYSCNYDKILDKHEPDLALFQFVKAEFESLEIVNAKDNNSIPKIGLAIIDAASALKNHFHKMMERYDIEYVFSIHAGMGENFPEIKERIFYVPHFIDADINYDYELDKNIPVLLTGNFESNKKQYEWRSLVKDTIAKNFPTLYFKHPGYDANVRIPEMLRINGEKYFKTLNSSWIVPTSGGFKNLLVMKHLEIPGANSCLVCKESSNVKEFGFRDMINCVFANHEEIVDKLNYLFSNPNELKRITQYGFELVHSKHTHKNRPQLYQLYQLLKSKKANQKIVQPTLLGDLELVDMESQKETIHIRTGEDVKLITQADTKIAQKKYYTAEKICLEVTEFAEYIYDAKLRLYFIHMLNKRKVYAYPILRQLLFFGNSCLLSDPFHLSALIIYLLANKRREKALYYAQVLISKRHKELDYARLLAFKLNNEIKYYHALLSDIKNSDHAEKLKTMYYSYSSYFNLLSVLEKIVKKNITTKHYRYKKLIYPTIPEKGEISLYDIELPVDRDVLLKDMNDMVKHVKSYHKIIRKMQQVKSKYFHWT